jgi:hypothetical protein
VAVLKQPTLSEYVIVVLPIVTPVTTPEASMLATEGLADDHEPPLTECVSETVLPTHTTEGPEIAAGVVLTVTCVTAEQPEPIE